MKAVKELLGKYDKEHHNPKILIGSKNITFLSKTFTNALVQNLQNTTSQFTYDKARNIITIGNVELILIGLEDPSTIYGYSCACFRGDTLVATEKGDIPIKDLKIGDKVLTTKGFKKLKAVKNQGLRECIKVTVDDTDIICTPEHRFIDCGNNEIEAQNLKKEDRLVKLNETLTKETGFLVTSVAHLTAKTSNVVGQYTVYDIEVEDCHEFFANGIRVHNCAIIDELDELPTNIAMEAVKSVNDRIRQQIEGFREPFLAFATTSQGLKGLYQTVLHFKKNGIGYVLMRARTKDNTFLPKDYVKNMYSIYNEKERKCLLEGEFISIDSGLVYPDYNPVLNKLDVDLYDSIEENDTVYVGNDFNSFGNAGVACIVKQGAIVIIKDYTFPDVRRIPEILRYDFPTQKIVWIPDATATAIYTQYKKELRIHNIKIAYRKSNPLVQDRVFAINKLLYAQKLFVCPMCKEVEHTFLTHQKDAKTGMPTKGGQGAPDHHGDACSYAVYHILCWCREMKDLYNITLGRRRMTRLGSVGQEVDADYKLLNPDKIALELPENVTENLNPS